ncbi:alpha/beta hydrolase [Mycolicibacterium peregrinum]|uniref:alpha/beta hydrolase n=1 Tax=Mycolicibacterium peregrinum TaxID=43304 RepID=UPI000AA5B25C|nr:alpha/beta hydrolase [Mycolicibacterium peregrinum]
MTVTVEQVKASQPDALTRAGAQMEAAAAAYQTQIDRQQANLDKLKSGWQGTASDAAIADGQKTLEQMRRVHEAMVRVQAPLQAGGAQLTQIRSSVLQTVAQLEGQGWQVASDGTVSVRPGSALDFYARLSPVNALMVRMLAVRNTAAVKKLLAQFDAADQQTDEAVRQAVAGLTNSPGSGAGGGAPTPGDKAEPQIPDTKDPHAIHDWWLSLTPEQKAQMLRDHPDKIGNLNGIPTGVQSEANLKIQKQDLARVNSAAEAHHVSVDEVRAHPEKYGLTATDITRYHNAVEVQKALDRYGRDAKDSRGGTPEILLKKYDPEAFGGKGAAAIAIGNPDTANNTTVKVSGLTTSVKGGSLDNPDPVNLYNETSMADPSKSNSVVMWMGYDAPDDQAVAVPNMARHGAELLAADVNALDATHLGSSHLTVIGHSYGSTTVADAAAGFGMRADDIVLIGSPGTDLAKSAADFHLPPDGHLYVGAASTDPVTYLGREHMSAPGLGLGTDPSIEGYGSTRFDAESSLRDYGTDHSRYFEQGSESLYNMADIASGHGDRLQQNGMTAEHRSDHWYAKVPVVIPTPMGPIPVPGTSITIPGVDQAFDPEADRRAQDNHRH